MITEIFHNMGIGNDSYRGILSQEEMDEIDALEEICNNLADLDGRSQYCNIRLLNRKTELMMKGNEIMKERNDRYAATIKPIVDMIVSGFDANKTADAFGDFLNNKMIDILTRS